MKLAIKDIIAILVLIMCFVLLLMKYNGWIQGTMTLILAYYFVKRTEGKDNGQ